MAHSRESRLNIGGIGRRRWKSARNIEDSIVLNEKIVDVYIIDIGMIFDIDQSSFSAQDDIPFLDKQRQDVSKPIPTLGK